MERLVRIAKALRTEHRFNGYIHLKTIPGCSDDLTNAAALYADRLSVNIELPSENSLHQLAPGKNKADIIRPMRVLRNGIRAVADERRVIKRTPAFAPAGQSTQMVIGASPEDDLKVLTLADALYKSYALKRVYYSGYVPISNDIRLPGLGTAVPLVRENRLYQADWLMRFYGFGVGEIVDSQHAMLDLDIDPKLSWALRHLHLFPVDVNKASYELILRIPGVGLSSARKIVAARKHNALGSEHLIKLGIAWRRARHFIVAKDCHPLRDHSAEALRKLLLHTSHSKFASKLSPQLMLAL